MKIKLNLDAMSTSTYQQDVASLLVQQECQYLIEETPTAIEKTQRLNMKIRKHNKTQKYLYHLKY